MARLGETTASLRRLKQQLQQTAQSANKSFDDVASFGPNPGRLKMLIRSPQTRAADPALVVLLHGCAQGAEGFAKSSGWIELADHLGLALLAPEQSTANNPNRCFNWFLPTDVRRGEGEAASIASMINHVVTSYNLNPARVFITGLSAGGAMTAAMLATYPELFAGGAVLAGLPYGAASNVVEAMMAMHRPGSRSRDEMGARVRGAAPAPAYKPRLTVWHGDSDWTVNVANGEATAAQWAAACELPQDPVVTEHSGVRTSRWLAPGSKKVMVELNIVSGFGHGAPLSTRGSNGIGAPGPYMIEIGISSTREIAKFWGLAPNRSDQSDMKPEPVRISASSKMNPDVPPPGLAASVMKSVSGRVPAKIAEAVAAALRTAGLK